VRLMGQERAPRGTGWSTGFISRAEAATAPRPSFWDRAKAAAR